MNVRHLLEELAARLPERLRPLGHSGGGQSPVPLRYVLGFVVLFALFFTVHLFALRLPQLIREQAARVPGLELFYTDARLEVLPPALVLNDVSVGGAILGNERLHAREVRLAPSFGALVTGRIGLTLTADEGKGTLSAFVAAPLWGAGDTHFALNLGDWPLTSLSAVTRFDPQASGSIALTANADVAWQSDAGRRLLPRSCEGSIRGEVRVDSLRNGLQGLLADRFADGSITFAGNMAGRVFSLTEARLSTPALDAAVSGKAAVDWRAPRQTELNLVAEIKTEPDMVSSQLMTPVLRERLTSGQTLPVAIQGTLFMPAFAPLQ